MIRLSAAVLAAGVPVAGMTETIEASYLCTAGATFTAIYLNDRNPRLVVVSGDSVLTALRAAPAASGARYEGVAGKSGYVWWTRGEKATLYWVDAETGVEEPYVEGCRQVPPALAVPSRHLVDRIDDESMRL